MPMDPVVPFLPPHLLYPGLYNPFGWLQTHAHQAGLDAAKTLASLQFQKQTSNSSHPTSSSSSLPNEAKPSLADVDNPLLTGLVSLLDKHRVDRDLKELIVCEVKGIVGQVETNVRSSILLNGRALMMPTSSSSSNNNSQNYSQHTNHNLMSLKQLAQRT